jgi:hypothetical protein
MSGGSVRRWDRRKIVIAVLASIGILAMLATLASALVAPFLTSGPPAGTGTRDAAPTPSPTTPAVVIPPLPVRPVVEALVATPEQCPTAAPPPPSEPLQTCDLEKTAVYTLGPTALQLQLTDVQSVKSPIINSYVLQVTLDAASSAAFADYTAAHRGERVAFLRNGVVVSAPAIDQPINSPTLLLSGDLTAPQADTIARLLREAT